MRRIYDGFNPYESQVEISDPIFDVYKDRLSFDYVPHISRNVSYGSERTALHSRFIDDQDNLVYLSDEDCYKIFIRLQNAFKRFQDNFHSSDYPPNFDEYCRLHRRVWDCYSSTALKLWLLDEDVPMVEKYDNLDVVILNNIPTNLDLSQVKETDLNLFESVRRRTQKFTDDYYQCKHDRNVRNTVYYQRYKRCEL